MITLIQILGLLISIIIHEVAHGYVAYKLGDSTARQQGRLTLNPIPHVDPLGTILIPGLLIMTGAPFFIGWAKPVPVDPRYFARPFRDMMLVAIAGPVSNIVIGFTCLFMMNAFGGYASSLFQYVMVYMFTINVFLAVFNMIPIPPLDGSRVLSYFLGASGKRLMFNLERYGFLIIFACVYFDLLIPIVRIGSIPFFKLAGLD